MSRATACFSIYSLISKRSKWILSTAASCLATSVFPTPVGPAKIKLPVGESGLPSPARDRFTAVATDSIASLWPKTTFCRFDASSFSSAISELEPLFAGIRAIRETTFSTSLTLTVAPCFPSSRKKEPTSSITSMALSGRKRSFIYRSDSSAIAFTAFFEYLTSWCSSYLLCSPLRISLVSLTDGSSTSIFWNLLDSARSFSIWFLYSS